MEAPPPDPSPFDPGQSTRLPSAAELLGRAARTLVARGGVVALSFAFAVLLARTLSPSERGNLAVLQALTGIVAVVANFAIAKAIIHHLGRGLTTAREASGAALVLAAVSGMLGILVFVPLTLWLRHHALPGLAGALILVAILLAVPLLVREYVSGVLISIGRSVGFVMAQAVQPLVGTAVLVVVLVSGTGSLGTAVTAWAAGVLVSGVSAVALSAWWANGVGRPRITTLASLARFGIRTYPAFIAQFLNLRVDQFVVRALSSAATLGQYAVAVNVGELLIRVPNIILWAVAGDISARSRTSSATLVSQFCRWTLVAVGAVACLIAIITPVGLPFLFGSDYRPAVRSVLLLLPGMVCYAPAAIISEYFIVQRSLPGRAALIAGVSIVASVLLNLPLTPALGAAGASIASSVSYALMLATALAFFAHDARISPKRVLLPSRHDLHVMRSVLVGRPPGPPEPQV